MGISRFTSKEFVIFCQASKIGNVFNYKMMESAELPKQPTTLQKSMMNPMNVLKIASFEVLISQSHGKNGTKWRCFQWYNWWTLSHPSSISCLVHSRCVQIAQGRYHGYFSLFKYQHFLQSLVFSRLSWLNLMIVYPINIHQYPLMCINIHHKVGPSR